MDSPFCQQTIIIIFACLCKQIPVGSRLGMGLAVPCRLSHGRKTLWTAWTGEAFVSPCPAPARTAEARTSVQDTINTPSVSKAHRKKRRACGERHGLPARTLKRAGLHYPEFISTSPPAYVTNSYYRLLPGFWEFCTRHQYEMFWGQGNATLLLAKDFLVA